MIDKIIQKIAIVFRIDANYFIKGGFWLLLTQAMTILGSLLVASIFTRMLIETDYGTYRYLVALAVFFTTFSLTGIGQSILLTASKGYTSFFPHGIKASFLYGQIVTIISFSASAYYYINGANELAIGCLLIGLMQPAINTSQNIVPYLQGLKKFNTQSKFQFFKVLTISIVSIATIFYTKNILWLFFAFLASQLITTIIGALIFHKKKHADELPATEKIKNKYLSYAKHLSLQNVITGTSARIDSILIFQLLGASSMAIFSIAILLPSQISGMAKNLMPLLLPKFANQKSIQENKKNIKTRSVQLFILLSIFSMVIFFLIPIIYNILFPNYLNTIKYAQILTLGIPASVFFIPMSILSARLENKKLYKINIYGSVIRLFTIVTFIYIGGLLGGIIARVFSMYVTSSLSFYFLFKSKSCGTNNIKK